MANCKTCLHAAVCAKRIATGGQVKECENFLENKTGRWVAWTEMFPRSIFVGFERKKKGFCSYCGAFRTKENYCPNCGADMRPKEDQDG